MSYLLLGTNKILTIKVVLYEPQYIQYLRNLSFGDDLHPAEWERLRLYTTVFRIPSVRFKNGSYVKISWLTLHVCRTVLGSYRWNSLLLETYYIYT